MGSQSTAKPLISSTAATTITNTPSDAVTSATSGVTGAPKPPAMRSRALSLQARTTATGVCVGGGWFQCLLSFHSDILIRQTASYQSGLKSGTDVQYNLTLQSGFLVDTFKCKSGLS